MSSYTQTWGGATVSITYPDSVTYQTAFDVSFTVDGSTMEEFDAIAFLSTLGISQTVDLSGATWEYTFVSDDPAWNYTYTGTLGDTVSPWTATDTQYIIELADPVTTPYTWLWGYYNDQVTWSINDLVIQADTTFTLRLDDLGIVAGPIEPAFIVLDPPAQAVMDVNHAPLAVDDVAHVTTEELAVSGNVLANDSDVDQGTVLAVAAPGEYAGDYGLLLLAADGSYTYKLDIASAQVQALGRDEQRSEHFTYAATDGQLASEASLDILVRGGNDAPVLAAPLADLRIAPRDAFSLQLPTDSFVDIDAGDTLDYTATLSDGSALPAWLHFDAETLTFSGIAPKTKGQLEILVSATDRVAATGSTEGSLSASDVFVLSIGKDVGIGRAEHKAVAKSTVQEPVLGAEELPAWLLSPDTRFSDAWTVLHAAEANAGGQATVSGWAALPALDAYMGQAGEASFSADSALTSSPLFATQLSDLQSSAGWGANARFETF